MRSAYNRRSRHRKPHGTEYKLPLSTQVFGTGYLRFSPSRSYDEVKTALELYGVTGPYVLMPHSHANIYAMQFQQAYPELVQSIISIDGQIPAELNDNYYKTKHSENVANINLTSIFELTGFERVLSLVREDIFYIDKMRAMYEIYGEEEISVYRNSSQ